MKPCHNLEFLSEVLLHFIVNVSVIEMWTGEAINHLWTGEAINQHDTVQR